MEKNKHRLVHINPKPSIAKPPRIMLEYKHTDTPKVNHDLFVEATIKEINNNSKVHKEIPYLFLQDAIYEVLNTSSHILSQDTEDSEFNIYPVLLLNPKIIDYIRDKQPLKLPIYYTKFQSNTYSMYISNLNSYSNREDYNIVTKLAYHINNYLTDPNMSQEEMLFYRHMNELLTINVNDILNNHLSLKITIDNFSNDLIDNPGVFALHTYIYKNIDSNIYTTYKNITTKMVNKFIKDISVELALPEIETNTIIVYYPYQVLIGVIPEIKSEWESSITNEYKVINRNKTSKLYAYVNQIFINNTTIIDAYLVTFGYKVYRVIPAALNTGEYLIANININ